jgi:ferritin-like metal-binding protein YciE
MAIKNLQDLLVNQLDDLFDSEGQVELELPKMAKAATSLELRELFETRAKQNGEQRERLQKIGNEIGVKLGTNSKTCVAMQGLIKEGREMQEVNPRAQVLDAALILAAQKGAHYQIAAYGSARAYAAALGKTSAESLLKEAVDEQSNIDKELSKLAIKTVNRDAVQPSA